MKVYNIDKLHNQRFANMRFEVIDSKGRAYVVYGAEIEFSVQDNSRTLKIFVKNEKKVLIE